MDLTFRRLKHLLGSARVEVGELLTVNDLLNRGHMVDEHGAEFVPVRGGDDEEE